MNKTHNQSAIKTPTLESDNFQTKIDFDIRFSPKVFI